MGLVILDELGCLPFSRPGGALLFHLQSKLYEQSSVMITTTLTFAEWPSVLDDAKMTTVRLIDGMITVTSSKRETSRYASSTARQSQRIHHGSENVWPGLYLPTSQTVSYNCFH